MLVSSQRVLLMSAFVSLALGSVAHAAEPTSYACAFDTGSTHIFDKGRFSPEKSGTLAFEILAIDEQAQTAQFKTPRGVGALKTVQAVNATHFLEVTPDGYLNITTVYDRDETAGDHPAVHSRHFGVLEQPIVSQFIGTCRAKS